MSDMSSRLRRQANVLLALAKSHPSVCKAILRGADKDLVQCLSECAYNVLRGNVPLTPVQKAQLTKYKQKLRRVANKKTALKQKQKTFQTGGFVPLIAKALLGPLISLAAKGVVKGLSKKRRGIRRHG